MVGVIDTGIWPEHPSFADDGSYPAPDIPPLDATNYATCDFGNTAQNVHDAPFTCNNKLIGARQTMDTYRALIGADPDEFDSARDDDGHGTHTASTAAGNADVAATLMGTPRGNVSGIAPRAQIIAYKALGNLGGFTSDLASSIDQAVADGVDVINYSIGGGPSLAGADDIAFLFAADAGVFVATSAGNSGPGAGTIGGPATIPWVTSVGASTQSRFFSGEVRLGKGGTVTGASITGGTGGFLPLVDAEFAGGELCIPGDARPGQGRRQDRPVQARGGRPGREEPRGRPRRRRRHGPLQHHQRRQPVHRQPRGPVGARRPDRGPGGEGLHRRRRGRRGRRSSRAGSRRGSGPPRWRSSPRAGRTRSRAT